MPAIILNPVSRSATSGETVSFQIRVKGVEGATIGVVPGKGAEDFKVDLEGDYQKASFDKPITLNVKVPQKSPMA